MNCFKMSVALLLFIVIVQCASLTEQGHELSGIHNYSYCSDDGECPTWFVCNSTNVCQCGNEHDQVLVCDDKTFRSAVLNCNCVTYDKKRRSTYLGLCMFNCDNHRIFSGVYETLPENPEILVNESICTGFNRAGVLCGDCEEGYSPFVISYNLSCVKCPDGHKNW